MNDLSGDRSRCEGPTPSSPAGNPAGGTTDQAAPGSGQEPQSRGTPSIWRHRPFVVLWLARIVSVTGGMASMMAMQWWVLDVTGSAQAMAALGALFTVVVAAV
ncbi:MAG TPA: hypothetical protein VIK92_01660, partial [Thermaerobacter sp.]